MAQAVSIPITSRTTTPPDETISDLLALHNKIGRLIDSNTMSDGVMDHLVNAAGNLRFDVAKTPARSMADVAAKIEFFFRDHCEVGDCEEFTRAMRAGIRADLRRLGGVA